MKELRHLLGGLVLTGALLVAGAAWFPVATTAADAPTRTETVALDGATSARVEIGLGAGRLRLAGGSLAGAGTPMPSGELLRGQFFYEDSDLEPTLAYAVDNGVGHLELEQGDAGAWPWDDHESVWELYLNPTVPTELSVEVGAGESELALGGLTLTDLDVAVGAGETTLDFVGDWRAGLAAEIDGGAGELTLRLPRHVGVRVAVDPGVGDVDADGFDELDGVYVNDAYGTAAVTLDLAVRHGAGKIDLELVG